MKIERTTNYGDKKVTELLDVWTLPDGKVVVITSKQSKKADGKRMHRDTVTLILNNAQREEIREALKKPA